LTGLASTKWQAGVAGDAEIIPIFIWPARGRDAGTGTLINLMPAAWSG
jgi:hypothetical protein